MAPNIKQREFLSEGAVQVSQQVRSKLSGEAEAGAGESDRDRRAAAGAESAKKCSGDGSRRRRRPGRAPRKEGGAFACPPGTRPPARTP